MGASVGRSLGEDSGQWIDISSKAAESEAALVTPRGRQGAGHAGGSSYSPPQEASASGCSTVQEEQ